MEGAKGKVNESETREGNPADAPRTAVEPLTGPHDRGNILIVDDEVFIRKAFQLYFDTIGFNVRVAEGGQAALEIFEEDEFAVDVVLLDLVMPGIHGLDLLKAFKQCKPDVEVIIATGCGSLSSAIEAMRNGAFDYITKPIVNFEEELLKVIEDALLHRRNRLKSRHIADLRGFQANSGFTFHNLSLFDKFVKLSDLVGLWRHDNDAAAGTKAAEHKLSTVEEFLDSELGIAAGILFSRGSNGELAPAYSWGKVRPMPVNAEWFSNRELYHSILNAEVFVFPTEDLKANLLADEPGKIDESPMAIHLPLILEGVHRGTLLLFFSKGASELKNADFLDNGHPYLVIAPMLASFFLGVIKSV